MTIEEKREIARSAICARIIDFAEEDAAEEPLPALGNVRFSFHAKDRSGTPCDFFRLFKDNGRGAALLCAIDADGKAAVEMLIID